MEEEKTTTPLSAKIFNLRNILGVGLGATAGFLYWYFIGCSSGTCPITSNPWMSMLWGTLLGWILSRKNGKWF